MERVIGGREEGEGWWRVGGVGGGEVRAEPDPAAAGWPPPPPAHIPARLHPYLTIDWHSVTGEEDPHPPHLCQLAPQWPVGSPISAGGGVGVGRGRGSCMLLGPLTSLSSLTVSCVFVCSPHSLLPPRPEGPSPLFFCLAFPAVSLDGLNMGLPSW